VQFRAHPGPLAALAGEQEPDPDAVAGAGRAGGQARRGQPGGQRGQPGGQLVPVRAGDHGPVLERRPGGGQ
jgi:hypothetical protein